MDFIMNNYWALWLAVGFFFLILELATVALVSIWFVPAAVIASIFSLFVDNFVIQASVFAVFSIVFLVLFKTIYNKYHKNKNSDVNKETSLVGSTAKTVADTDGFGGKVIVGDVYWRAVSEDGDTIDKDEIVTIKFVDGTTLVVNRVNK